MKFKNATVSISKISAFSLTYSKDNGVQCSAPQSVLRDFHHQADAVHLSRLRKALALHLIRQVLRQVLRNTPGYGLREPMADCMERSRQSICRCHQRSQGRKNSRSRTAGVALAADYHSYSNGNMSAGRLSMNTVVGAISVFGGAVGLGFGIGYTVMMPPEEHMEPSLALPPGIADLQ